MKYVVDMHTHTVASGHAYNTINEMIQSAANKGLELLGISEHGPAMPGSTNIFYFQNLNILERRKYGIEVRYGAELNNSSLNPNGFRINAYDNDLEILKYCMKYDVPVIMGSDAHREEDVGEFERAEKVLNKIGFPEDLIINSSLASLGIIW